MPSEPPPPWALDGSPAFLAGFRQNFPTFALIADPNILTVFERGIAANSQGKTCVLDKAHAYFHKRGMLASRSKEDCFARPFMGLTDLEMQQAIMLYNQDMLNAHQMAVAQHTLAVANARAAAAAAGAQPALPQTPQQAPAASSASATQQQPGRCARHREPAAID